MTPSQLLVDLADAGNAGISTSNVQRKYGVDILPVVSVLVQLRLAIQGHTHIYVSNERGGWLQDGSGFALWGLTRKKRTAKSRRGDSRKR